MQQKIESMFQQIYPVVRNVNPTGVSYRQAAKQQVKVGRDSSNGAQRPTQQHAYPNNKYIDIENYNHANIQGGQGEF